MSTLTFNPLDARQRPADYLNICQNIADSYPHGISHGIQKDAIQNGLDAVVNKTLKFTFEIVETKRGRFFTMTDTNTCGLTGPVLKLDDYERELNPDDHWARFESFAFTKTDPDALGARGQGKFIFLAGSKQGKMFYDSLRKDRTYRLGFTQATHTGCPMWHWDEDEADKVLKEQTGLSRLSEIGTRIIILDPADELIQDLKSGSFIRAVHETWFRAIEKGKVEIHVKVNETNRVVTVCDPYPVPMRDSDLFKTWVRDNDTIEPEKGQTYRIKHLRVACKKNGSIPEHLCGIAILHNNMKITTINMDWAPQKIRDSIFGFVEFDRLLDRELRKGSNQDPNHYDLRWRRMIPRAVKAYLHEQLEEFGIQKLGIGIDPREKKRRMRNTAEQWAMRHLSRFARELDLFGGHGFTPPPTGTVTPPTKQRGVMLHEFKFPVLDRAPRINWGEVITGFRASIFNKTSTPFSANLKVLLLFGDSIVLDIDDKKGLKVLGKGRLENFNPYSVEFGQGLFPNPGVYKLRVKLIDESDRSEVDSLTRIIYLEKDPDLKAPFEVYATPDFPPEFKHRQWLTHGALGHDPTLHYNTAHPAYRRVEEGEVDLGCYLFEIFLEGSLTFILNRPDSVDGSADFHPLDNKRIKGDPKDAYEEIISKISEIRSRFYIET